MEKCSDTFVNVLRNLSLFTWKHLPIIASFISRVQFFAQWAVQKHRSDFTHTTVTFRSPSEFHRGKIDFQIYPNFSHFFFFSSFVTTIFILWKICMNIEYSPSTVSICADFAAERFIFMACNMKKMLQCGFF